MKYINISIKKLLSTGPSENSVNFGNSEILNNFLGRNKSYVTSVIRQKKHIITDALRNYYVIVSYNGNKVNAEEELQNFYNNHVWENGIVSEMAPIVKPTKEQIQKNKEKHEKVGKLLSRIQIKYGGLTKAEGTKEFLELQNLLNTERN